MRGVKEQHDCQLSDFTVTVEYIEYKKRQTKTIHVGTFVRIKYLIWNQLQATKAEIIQS